MTNEEFIDFGNEESCTNYLTAKFDDLLQGINNLYGRELMEELLRRMEKTIATFHQDVKSLISGLKTSEVNKEESKISSSQLVSKPAEAKVSPDSEAGKQEKLTEWEQNLLK
ncbi:MAG: hypothetical protein ISS81_10515 [Candidatus Marinimicrobia bacterium]|nr:hypothetical protein [Candidatus Neomarinimicrobiota bacterium]